MKSFFVIRCVTKIVLHFSTMAGVEQPCYTLINFPTDTEPHNDMQLKLDLGNISAVFY